MAKVTGRSLPISTKQSIEICNFVRYKELTKAKDFLNKVVEKKAAVPFTRFNGDVGHKRKLGPARFPVKTSKEIIQLLESVEANAQFKGLDTSRLIINHICANKAGKQFHYGRKRRRQMKRTNIDVIVEEQKQNEDKKAVEKKTKETPALISKDAKENKQKEQSKEASTSKSTEIEGKKEQPKQNEDKKGVEKKK